MENNDVPTIEEFAGVMCSDKDMSWAEYELKAAVYGMPVDAVFCRRAVVMATMLWHTTRPVVEGILFSDAWKCAQDDEGLVDDVFQLFRPPGRRFEARLSRRGAASVQDLYDDLMTVMLTGGACDLTGNMPGPGYIQPETRKNMVLDALERRFPLMPVRYYAANAAQIHKADEKLAIWIKDRLRARADAAQGEAREKLCRIYDSMAAEFVNRHFTAAVFMK